MRLVWSSELNTRNELILLITTWEFSMPSASYDKHICLSHSYHMSNKEIRKKLKKKKRMSFLIGEIRCADSGDRGH